MPLEDINYDDFNDTIKIDMRSHIKWHMENYQEIKRYRSNEFPNNTQK